MSHSPPRSLTIMRSEVPFVDREEELSLLENLMKETMAGKGQVLFVAGEGGVGKTRLVQELGHRARKQGAIFAIGASYQEEVLVPYSAWIEVIRAVIHQSAADTFSKATGRILAEVGRLVPELATKAKELGIKGWISGPETGEMIAAADTERIRLFQSIIDFLIHGSQAKPLLLFFDDVQWADAATLQLLHYLCRRIREEKIMVLAAYRDEELSEESALSRLLLDMNRERILKQVKLNRFTPDFVAQVISHQLGGEAVDPEFLKLIYSKTGGNPFFVEEILHSLLEQGHVVKSGQGWTLHELGQVEIPSTVRSLIKQRVSHLQEPALQTLFIGAVIGMEFGYELLSKVRAQDEEESIKQLEEAVRAGLIKERHGPKGISYIFADDQIREFLYNDLSLIRRRKLHIKVAEAMEKLSEHERDRPLEELANHFIQGGNEAKAIEYSRMAGDRASRLYASREAERHFATVLDLLGEEREDERLEVLIKIGDTAFRLGELEECERYYKEAIAIARRRQRNREAARIYPRLGDAYWRLDDNKQHALESYEEGLKTLQNDHDTLEEASICQGLARLLVNTGERERGLEWCEKSARLARSLGAYEVLAQALQTRAIGLPPARENKREILGLVEESLRISLEHQLEDATSRAYINLDSIYHHIYADYEKSEEASLKGLEYDRRIGYIAFESFQASELALYAYIPLGRWDKALESASLALRIGSELGELYVTKALTPLALANLYKGNIERAEEYLLRAYPLAEKSQWTEILYYSSLAIGELYVRKNEMGKAEQYLLRGSELASKIAHPPAFEVYFELVNLYCKMGDLARANGYYKELQHRAKLLDERWGYAYESWSRGLIAAYEKDLNEAKEAFKKSAELWKDLKHPYNYARTTQAYGEALSESGNQSEGRRLLAEAQQTFSHLGAELDLRKSNDR